MHKYKLKPEYMQLLKNLVTGQSFQPEDAFHDPAQPRQRAVTGTSQVPVRTEHEQLLEKLAEAGLLSREPLISATDRPLPAKGSAETSLPKKTHGSLGE